MDLSGNYIPYNRTFQRWELQSRRLRLISDIMEDYQENMRRVFRLIGCELGISSHVFPPSQRNASSLNVEDWLDRVSQVNADMYSPEGRPPEEPEPPRSPHLHRPNIRRGFVYTQLLEPRDNQDTGITAEQIENSTRSIQYDPSMNEPRCPITWDQFEQGQNILQINNCNHIFSQPALMEWFQHHSICPVCRASVLQQNQPSTQSSGINLQTTAQMNISDRFSSILRQSQSSSEVDTIPSLTPFGRQSGNTPTSTSRSAASATINQIISGILTSVNGAVNTDTGYYESEFAFNVDDFLSEYTQLVESQPLVNTHNNMDQTPNQ